MRHSELSTGIDEYDKSGNVVGASKVAAKKVSKMCLFIGIRKFVKRSCLHC